MPERASFDVAAALGAAARWRDAVTADPLTDPFKMIAVALSDTVATEVARYFPDPEDARIAGHALVIASLALSGLPREMPMSAVVNVAGLAGQRLAMGGQGE